MAVRAAIFMGMGGVRRSGRIKKEIAIVLLGTDSHGRVFAEKTRTVVLSLHGAGILSAHRLAPDEVLTLRLLGSATEVAVRLVGEMGKDARGHIYGVAFVDPDLDFWQLEFPPPPVWPKATDATLECSLCQSREAISQTEIEADVYTLASYILRFCPKCGATTEWKRPQSEEIAQPVAPQLPPSASRNDRAGVQQAASSTLGRSPRTVTEQVAERPKRGRQIEVSHADVAARQALPPAATAVMARSANRRRDVRTRVGCTACIRQGGTEEIVECDNISRGGLSFRSRKSYTPDSLIEVAVPYSPGGHAIFVLARVRHSTPLSSGTLFRYGAAYEPKTLTEAEPAASDDSDLTR